MPPTYQTNAIKNFLMHVYTHWQIFTIKAAKRVPFLPVEVRLPFNATKKRRSNLNQKLQANQYDRSPDETF